MFLRLFPDLHENWVQLGLDELGIALGNDLDRGRVQVLNFVRAQQASVYENPDEMQDCRQCRRAQVCHFEYPLSGRRVCGGCCATNAKEDGKKKRPGDTQQAEPPLMLVGTRLPVKRFLGFAVPSSQKRETGARPGWG